MEGGRELASTDRRKRGEEGRKEGRRKGRTGREGKK
jgi:hypothetical protein